MGPANDDRSQRRRQLIGREHVVAAIAELLFRHDPIGLNFGHNVDEYEPEAETITLRLAEATTRDELRRIVREEFVSWFDPDLAGPESRYSAIAEEIWTLRSDA